MAKRIPKSFIDELGARTDLVALLSSRITFLKKSGSNHFACCPFHDEKTPSFSVNSNKGFYHCFGCGASGDGVRFLMDYDNLSFPEAVEQLALFNGLEVPYEESHSSYNLQQKTQFQLGLQCLADAAAFFQQLLRSDAGREGRDYLQRRGLNRQAIEQFQLGLSPSNNALLQHLGSKYSHQLLQDVGLIGEKEGRHYDWFRGRIMFPIHNVKGQVIGFGARAMHNEEPKYLNSPETNWFNKRFEFYGLRQAMQGSTRGKTLIVTEGYMDVISLHQAGIDYAIAALGTAIGETHISQLQKRAEKVYFAFDGDKAGEKAARKALEAVFLRYNQGRTQDWYFTFLPAGEDPDSLLQKSGAEGFQEVLKQSLSISSFLLQVINDGLGHLQTAEAQMQRIQHAQSWLEKLNHLDYRECLREQIQKTFALPRLTVSAELSKAGGEPFSPNSRFSPSSQPTAPKIAPKPPLKVIRLLGFLWLHPEYALLLRRWEYQDKMEFSPFWQLCYQIQLGDMEKKTVEDFLTARGWLEIVRKAIQVTEQLAEESQKQEFTLLIASIKRNLNT